MGRHIAVLIACIAHATALCAAPDAEHATPPEPASQAPVAALPATRPTLGEACDRTIGLPKDVDSLTPDQTILDGVTEGRANAAEAAVRACKAAADVEQSEARYPYRAGLALLALGRSAEALTAFERAMALGYPGGYLAIAEARADGTLGPTLPQDAAAAIAVASEGIARTGSSEIKRGLGSFLAHAAPPFGDRARARRLLEEAVAAGHLPAVADLALLLAEDANDGRDAARIRSLLDGAVAGGSRRAALIYGRLLDDGTGLARDLDAARRFYVKAAEGGSIDAMISAAAMMRTGEGGPKDIEEQRRWLARASALGNLDARRALGNSYIDETPNRTTLGLVLLEQLADSGSVEAAHGLGVRFQDADGVATDYGLAMKWFRRAADAGDGRAMNQIGEIYDYGQGVSIDHAEARHWYDLALGRGIAAAYTAIGMQYDHAMGVPRDVGKAFGWYQQGAEHGATESMNNLGFAYANARGVKRDLRLAVLWYQAAADRNDRTAQLNLSKMYLEGLGVPKDPMRGLTLLEQSAEQGLPQALNDLALLERKRPTGSGARAVELLRRAAAAGAAIAYNNLGMALTSGWDGKPDFVEATYWFRRSIEHASDLDPLAVSESQFQLGTNLLMGRGVARDEPAGKALILAAAKAHNPTALNYLHKTSSAAFGAATRRHPPTISAHKR